MRISLFLAALVGLCIATGLIGWYGAGAVLQAVAAVGWGAVLVVLVRVGETAGAGLAWWLVLPEARPGLAGTCMLLRWLRESINCLLPVAQVGGDLIGARLLTFWNMPGGSAGASVVVDLFVQTATQFLFTVVGLLCLIAVGGETAMVRWVALGLAVLGPALLGFFLAQRFGGFGLLERALLRLAKDPKWAALGGIASLNERLQEIWRRPGRLTAAFVLHLVIWFFGALAIWAALHFMGYPVSYRTALIIESLAQAVRGAAFVVPGAIGVQEGGFVALCAVFGIPAPVGIALSLIKRLPEIVLGIPGLLFWQVLEGRRLLGNRHDVAKSSML
jgi:putative membrane protein